jgi:hypothetical protein
MQRNRSFLTSQCAKPRYASGVNGVIIGAGGGDKGRVKRSPREEMALRVRMLNGRHAEDLYGRVMAELGDEGANVVLPIDLSENIAEMYLGPRAKAYDTPPLVDDLSEELANLIGDQSARTTVARYATVKARPMPTRMLEVSREHLEYRLWCNWCGTAIGWSDDGRRPFLEVITPDDLEVDYQSADPLRPTVIKHFRVRVVAGKETEVADVYDLTDLANPTFRVFDGDNDVTLKVDAFNGQTFDGADYWWRYAPTEDYPEGRPFHRVVISGDPRRCYRGISLVEGGMRLGVGRTYFWSGMRDAGFPRTHSIGLELDNKGSEEGGGTGGYFGPTSVPKWRHVNPEKPGTLQQFGPGYDPEAIARALNIYSGWLLTTLGRHVDAERTGGDPTALEAASAAELVAKTFSACRGHDALVFRRVAAIHNRASERTEGMEPANLAEAPLSALYRDEITEALATVQAIPEEGEE